MARNADKIKLNQYPSLRIENLKIVFSSAKIIGIEANIVVSARKFGSIGHNTTTHFRIIKELIYQTEIIIKQAIKAI